MAACQQSIARSPDAVNTAVAMGFLGEAYLAQGAPTAALPWLEQAVKHMRQFHFRSLQSWFMSSLAEAQRLHGHLVLARELVMQALALSQEITFALGIALAQHALARVAQAEGALAEAKQYLDAAQQTYAAIQGRYWVGRTHLDLAILAYSQEDMSSAARHLRAAHDLFTALQLSTYIERTEQLARDYGLVLSSVDTLPLEHRSAETLH